MYSHCVDAAAGPLRTFSNCQNWLRPRSMLVGLYILIDLTVAAGEGGGGEALPPPLASSLMSEVSLGSITATASAAGHACMQRWITVFSGPLVNGVSYVEGLKVRGHGTRSMRLTHHRPCSLRLWNVCRR